MDRLAVIDHRQQGPHVSRFAPIGLGELTALTPPPTSSTLEHVDEISRPPVRSGRRRR